MRFEHSAVVDGTVEQVFRLTQDYGQRLAWDPFLRRAELIGRARLLVTNDSAPQHLASAMGTPTLTIFGPTVPEFGFGPLAPGSASLGVADLACRPCDSHGPQRCPLGHWRCMTEQAPAAVAERALALLATASRR